MTKAVLVISFDEDRPERVMQTLDEVRTCIPELPDVKLYIGIREKAVEVLDLFKDVD